MRRFPLAVLATYATEGKNGQISHVPRQYALTEYKNEREKLLELLACLNRAAEETVQLLKHTEEFEQAGILCRVPNWWHKRNAAVSLSISLGGKKPSMAGFSALASVQPELAVDGIPLTREEIRTLLAQTEGPALLKGRWVEVDHRRLRTLLEQMDSVPGEITPSTNGAWLGELLSRPGAGAADPPRQVLRRSGRAAGEAPGVFDRDHLRYGGADPGAAGQRLGMRHPGWGPGH